MGQRKFAGFEKHEGLAAIVIWSDPGRSTPAAIRETGCLRIRNETLFPLLEGAKRVSCSHVWNS